MDVNNLKMSMEDPYGVRDIQLTLLAMLKDVDVFCRKNGINYSINGGTLLGAVRHGGFIPWDDDVDLMFDRRNYEKFLKAAAKGLPAGYGIIQEIWVKRLIKTDNEKTRNDEECIDLFVMDNQPDQPLVSGLKDFIIKALQGMLKKEIDYANYSVPQKLMVFGSHILGLPFSVGIKQKWYDKVSQWGNKTQTRKRKIYNALYKHISFEYDYPMIEEISDIPFENLKLMAIKDTDSYLTINYGNYMELPPLAERVPQHRKSGDK